MGVRIVVAITDRDWFESLRVRDDLTEVNFWAPSAVPFRALEPGELFLFKLHAPDNFIVGGGIFTYANVLPCSLAWAAFGTANGASSFPEMRSRIAKYRRDQESSHSDFAIGCRILTQPIFLSSDQWLPAPDSFSRYVVNFKSYSTDESDGLRLWEWFQDVAQSHELGRSGGFAEPQARFGEPVLVRPRLGQGAFRVLVTDSYRRICAVTGEKTLPALDAAHIRPYAEGGEHRPDNGLLLRRDIHSLFDAGYVTVTTEHHFEVSKRIREEFENGREYYSMHGRPINLPDALDRRPSSQALDWHNQNRFLG